MTERLPILALCKRIYGVSIITFEVVECLAGARQLDVLHMARVYCNSEVCTLAYVPLLFLPLLQLQIHLHSACKKLLCHFYRTSLSVLHFDGIACDYVLLSDILQRPVYVNGILQTMTLVLHSKKLMISLTC